MKDDDNRLSEVLWKTSFFESSPRFLHPRNFRSKTFRHLPDQKRGHTAFPWSVLWIFQWDFNVKKKTHANLTTFSHFLALCSSCLSGLIFKIWLFQLFSSSCMHGMGFRRWQGRHGTGGTWWNMIMGFLHSQRCRASGWWIIYDGSHVECCCFEWFVCCETKRRESAQNFLHLYEWWTGSLSYEYGGETRWNVNRWLFELKSSLLVLVLVETNAEWSWIFQAAVSKSHYIVQWLLESARNVFDLDAHYQKYLKTHALRTDWLIF